MMEAPLLLFDVQCTSDMVDTATKNQTEVTAMKYEGENLQADMIPIEETT